MPSYEYKCPKCELTMTIVRSLKEEERIPICVNDAQELTRVFEAPPIQFKGKGWGKD